MRTLLLLLPVMNLIAAFPLRTSAAVTNALVLNEYNAVTSNKYLESDVYNGSPREDSYFKTIPGMTNGRIEGNGNNWLA